MAGDTRHHFDTPGKIAYALRREVICQDKVGIGIRRNELIPGKALGFSFVFVGHVPVKPICPATANRKRHFPTGIKQCVYDLYRCKICLKICNATAYNYQKFAVPINLITDVQKNFKD